MIMPAKILSLLTALTLLVSMFTACGADAEPEELAVDGWVASWEQPLRPPKWTRRRPTPL